MKKALVFGAGNIGRGFIGQLLYQSGYEVVFFDVNDTIVDRLNQDRSYPIHLVSNERSREIMVHHVRAVNSKNMQAAANEFTDADIISTSVGVNVLDKIAPTMAAGLQNRWKQGNLKPLNIIICENMIRADAHLRSLVSSHLHDEEQGLLHEKIGFVEASIGRMVPSATGKNSENPLEINVEEYEELPVDRDGFKGEIPNIRNMIPFSPFDFYIKRKIYVHNMGHTLTAFLGQIRGHEYIYSAIGDAFIKKVVTIAYHDISEAMAKEYNVDFSELEQYTRDLIERFGNRALKDPVDRVAKDPIRKLSPNDRFVGALKLCEKHGIYPTGIIVGIAAGFLYADKEDEASLKIQADIDEKGLEAVVSQYSGLTAEERYFDTIIDFYQLLKSQNMGVLEGLL